MKKIILPTTTFAFLALFLAISYNFAEASATTETCRLNGKVLNVTEENIQVQISNVNIHANGSPACLSVKSGEKYQIKRDSFLRNAYGKNIFTGQYLIIDGTAGSSIGPNGAVSWEGWELESAGDTIIKLPITFEKDSALSGSTQKIYSVSEFTKLDKTNGNYEVRGFVIKNNPRPCPPCPFGPEGVCSPCMFDYELTIANSASAKNGFSFGYSSYGYSPSGFKVGNEYVFTFNVELAPIAGSVIEIIGLTSLYPVSAIDLEKLPATLKDIRLRAPNNGEVLTRDTLYTFKWEPDFKELQLHGTNISAQIYLVRTNDGAEIPISNGLIFTQSRQGREDSIIVKQVEYSKEILSPGKYKVVVRFYDLIPAKPCGVIMPGSSCTPSEEVNYGVIALAKSQGEIIVVEPTKDTLIEGRAYTVKNLNSNTSKIARKFFTDAYVSKVWESIENVKEPPHIIISDNKSFEVKYPLCSPNTLCPAILTNEQVKLNYEIGKYNFQLKKKYRFEISVRNTSNTSVPKNEFTLVSVNNLDGLSAIQDQKNTITTTSPTTSKAKISLFSKIIGWFVGLFK